MKKNHNTIRIIGGSHKSRKIKVTDFPELRPTTDRIRETVFNWLQPFIEGSCVLDLYAGSGALGFESASRGAKTVVAVEKNQHIFNQLQKNAYNLGFESYQCIHHDAESFLKRYEKPFDIVFLDPPFNTPTINTISDIIGPFIKPDGLLYREFQTKQLAVTLAPAHWELIKSKQVGQVKFELWLKFKHE